MLDLVEGPAGTGTPQDTPAGAQPMTDHSGRYTLVFNGAGAAETVDLSANGNRLLFSRQPANIAIQPKWAGASAGDRETTGIFKPRPMASAALSSADRSALRVAVTSECVSGAAHVVGCEPGSG